MNGAIIQTKVYTGYAKAAAFIGSTYSQYRPVGALNPVTADYITLVGGGRILLKNGCNHKYDRFNGKLVSYLYVNGKALS